MRRAAVRALAGACGALDAVTHRPFALRLVPGVRRCRLARLSQRLDERWATGVWPGHARHPAPFRLPCSACYRRPATRAVGGGGGWLERHPIELCGRCDVDPAAIVDGDDLARALAAARRRSLARR